MAVVIIIALAESVGAKNVWNKSIYKKKSALFRENSTIITHVEIVSRLIKTVVWKTFRIIFLVQICMQKNRSISEKE